MSLSALRPRAATALAAALLAAASAAAQSPVPQPEVLRQAPRAVTSAPALAREEAAAEAPQVAPLEAALAAAGEAYAAAFNERRFDDLARQWTADAELVEGGGRIAGREAIVASLRRWAEANPAARIAIGLDGVKALGGTVARVNGTIRFTEKPGAKPVETRFESLRVLEEGVWRIAESVVEPSQVEALDALDWMVGNWKGTLPGGGGTVEATYQRVAGGHLILGGIRTRAADGEELDVVELIHPDKATGSVRSWVFDSTGARAEGVVETDGTAFNRRYVGTTADGAAGTVARWVQLLVPTGPRSCTMQSIERSLDGRPLPDRDPIHLTRQR